MDKRTAVAQRRLRRRRRRHTVRPLLIVSLLFFAASLLLSRLLFSGSGLTVNAKPLPQDGGASASVSRSDWNLILVNSSNPIPEAYDVTLTQLKNGHAVDQRCYPDLQDMMDDCRAAGLSPVICSSYRTQQTQQALYDAKVESFLAQGYSSQDAAQQAGQVVALPGTSEHQLGLALDIVDLEYQTLDEAQEQTSVQQWLAENSWKYGFILRYPKEKSDVTGIVYRAVALPGMWAKIQLGRFMSRTSASKNIWRSSIPSFYIEPPPKQSSAGALLCSLPRAFAVSPQVSSRILKRCGPAQTGAVPPGRWPGCTDTPETQYTPASAARRGPSGSGRIPQ